MALEGITTTIGPYTSQFTGFVSKNWEAFKNATLTYGTQIWNSTYVQKVIMFVQPFFTKAAAYYPQWARFTWSTGTAVVTFISTILFLALIGLLVEKENKGRTTL